MTPRGGQAVGPALAAAREARAGLDRAAAMDGLEAAIRAGHWRSAALWWELVALIAEPGDCERIRALWRDSPAACGRDLGIIRAVARAACIAGRHEEAREPLRTAILLAGKPRYRVRALLGRGRRELARRTALLRGDAAGGAFGVRAARALADLRAVCDRLGVRPFLVSGTLLGYVRDGGIIAWDKDIDVGVFAEEIPDDLVERFEAEASFHVRRVDLSAERLRLHHANGAWIDVFPHYREGDFYWHDGTATRWWNTPFSLEEVEFLGSRQFVPDHPERYLQENYGDWRTPVVDYDARIDAPNVEITDQDHFDSLLYFSLLNAVVKRNTNLIRRYSALIRAQGEGAWLDRL